jgi:hypothetical protein
VQRLVLAGASQPRLQQHQKRENPCFLHRLQTHHSLHLVYVRTGQPGYVASPQRSHQTHSNLRRNSWKVP